MEEKDEESASFDGSAYILTFESLEMSLKIQESISAIDKERLGLCKCIERITSSSSKNRCSKSCTEYRKISLNEYI